MIVSHPMKRNFLRQFVFLAVIILSSMQAFAQATSEEAYDRGKMCYDQVKAAKLTSATKAEWARCADIFQKAHSAFPKDKKGIDSLFMAAKIKKDMYGALKSNVDAGDSIRLFNQLVREHPKSTLADDSLLEIAKMRVATKENDRAIKALEHLVETYPDGDVTPKAKVMLASLSAKAGAKAEVAPVVAAAAAPAVGDEAAEATAPKAVATKPATEENEDAEYTGVVIKSFEAEEVKNGAQLTFQTSRKAQYTEDFTEEGIRTKSPPVLEITIPNSKIPEGLATKKVFKSPFIHKAEIKKRLLGRGYSIVLTLAPDTAFDVSSTRNALTVKLGDRDGFDPKLKKAAHADTSDEVEKPSKAKAVASKKKRSE